MCKALADMRQEAKDEGRIEGKNEGRIEGKIEGKIEGMRLKGMSCYLNAISRGMSHEDALAVADIAEEEAATAHSLRKEGKL